MTTPAAATTPPPPPGMFETPDLHSVSSTAPLAAHVVQRAIGALKSDAGGAAVGSAGGFRLEHDAKRVRSLTVTCLFDGADSAAVADAAGSFQQLVLQVVESLCAHGIAAEQAHNSTSSYSVELAAACVSDGGDSAVGAALGPLTATGVASLEASDAVLTGSHAGSEASLWQSVSVGQDPFFAAGSTVLLVPKQQAAAVFSGHSTGTPAADVIAPRPVIGALGDFVALHDDDPFLATEVIIRAVETFTAKRIAVQRALHQPSVNTTSSTRERSSSSASERAATSLASAVMEPAIVVQISVARARAYTAAQQQQLQPPAAVVMSHAMITLVFCSTQSPTGALLQHIAHAQLSAVTDNDDGTPAAQPPPPLPVARTSLAWLTGMALHEALVARTNVFVAASLSEADESARRWLTALHAMIHPPIHGFATRRHRVTIAVALNALNAALQQPFGTPHYAALPDEEDDDDDVHAKSSSSTGAPYVELPVGCAALPASAPSGVPCVPRSLIQSGDAYFVLAMADVAVVRQSLPLIQRCVWLRRFLKTSMSAVRRGVPMLTPALRAHATEQLKKTLIPSSDLRLVVQWAAELAHVTELDPAAMPTTSERRRVEAMVRFHRSDAAPATHDTTVSRRSASTVEPAPRLGSPQSRGVSKLDDDSYVDDDEMAPSRPPHIVPTPLRWTRQPEGNAPANAALWLSDGNSPAAALQHQSSEFVAVTPPTLSWRRDTVAANLLETPPPAGAADASSSPTLRGPLNTRDASVGRDDRELPHETRSVAVSTVALEATSAFVPVQQTSLLLPPKRTTTSSTNTPPAVAPVTTTQTAGSQTTVSGDVITLAEVSQLLDEERQQHSNAGSQSPHDSTLLTAASTMRPLAETDGEDAVPPVPDANVPAMHSAQGLHRSHQHGEQVSSSSSSAVGRDDDDGDAAQTHTRSAPAGEEDEGGDVVTRDDLEELLEALRAWKQRAEELVEENDKLQERLASSEENVAALQLQLTLSQKREKESAAAAIRHAASKEVATPPPSSSSQKHAADGDDALAALRDERAALVELVRTLRGEAVAAESRHRTTMDDMDALLQRTCDQRDILQAKYDAKVLENQRLAHDTDMWRLAAQAAQEGRGDYEARVKSMQQEIDRLKADIASREALSRTASSADMSASTRIPVLTRTVSLLTDPVPAPLPPPPPSAAAEVPRPSMATVGVDPIPELNRATMTTGCDPVPPAPLKAAAVQTLEGPRVVGRASSPVAQLMAGWVPAQEAAEYKKRARAADITLGALQAELDQAAKDKVNLVASLRAAGSALADAERRADASNGTSTEKLAQLQQENADLRAWVAALRAEGEKLVAAAQASERDRADLLNVNESLKVLNGMMMQNQLGGQGALSPRQHHGLRDDPSPLLRRPAAVAPGGVARHGTPLRSATAGSSLHHVPSTNPTMTGQLSYITPTDQQHFGGFFVQHGASNAMRRSPSNEPPSPPSHAPTTARTSNTANGAALSPSSATARYGGASAGKRS